MKLCLITRMLLQNLCAIKTLEHTHKAPGSKVRKKQGFQMLNLLNTEYFLKIRYYVICI